MDVTNRDTLDVMDENIKNSLAFRLSIELSNMSFYVYCTSKLDYYILDTPISNRLIIEQGVSECLNFSISVEGMIPFTSF